MQAYNYRLRERERDLEINIGARREEGIELRVFLDVLPFAGAVFSDAGSERFFFLRCPFLLWISHRSPSLTVSLVLISLSLRLTAANTLSVLSAFRFGFP